MPVFDIDYNKLINTLLPTRLRKPVLRVWLQALIYPVKYVYNLFGANRAANLYYLEHNSQVIYLQAVLNDIFDSTLRRIKINDSTDATPIYTYMDAEGKQTPLYTNGENLPVYLYTDEDIHDAFNGFIVQVPTDLSYDENYMYAVIDKYRLPSKNKRLIVRI